MPKMAMGGKYPYCCESIDLHQFAVSRFGRVWGKGDLVTLFLSRISEKLGFHSTAIAIVVLVLALTCADVQAGVMLASRETECASPPNLACGNDASVDGEGSAVFYPDSAADEDGDVVETPMEPLRLISADDALSQSRGGASPPTHTSTGSAASSSLIGSSAVVSEPSIYCEFRRWREERVRLIEPLALRLLDPPKTNA